jgi:pyruvate,orthophosphate dikinase
MPIVALTAQASEGREQLGGKGWSITEMLRHGIPVPPAFTLTTEECARYFEAGRRIAEDLLAALPAAVQRIEHETGRTFGGGERPLLVSVRSGAATSMPGMMDTILNLGISDEVERALAGASGDAPYAADTRRRFHEQYEKVVGSPAPSDSWDQLRSAITAVFDSWQSDRAIVYRRERGIPDTGGTAVTVQAMVFGNLDASSGTGVVFSRDPTGASAEPYGEWLPMGQGEDVVSGSHDPQPLASMAAALPEAHAQLLAAVRALDDAAGVAQDIEFTVEGGKLWLLQARAAKVVTATGDGARPDAGQVIVRGLPACPGIASGRIVTDVDEAEARALDGEDIILARPTTTPHDVHAMAVVRGILTEVGGATSHAAVVSRELGVPCLVGCGQGTLSGLVGQWVTIDAGAGEVLEGEPVSSEARGAAR